ncbi:PRTRC system protein F [Burkholderia stabilis]|uniref:PRTRC system protein F n=1 Tax=Burkholderia stabilis TaxID=95485 RepID=A0A4Q2A5R6_9BURK|nr:PRTRC system protein F [Burkholderia stabilis]RXV64497.1 PRTRC system protein F [Burkholderia stabilis]
MLFSAERFDSIDIAAPDASWKPTRVAIARRRPATDFLTVPALPNELPVSAIYRWRTEMELAELVKVHFTYGPLRAADVDDPSDARDAFCQGFSAWLERIGTEQEILRYNPILLDRNAVHDLIQYLCNDDESKLTSPFYLGLEMADEVVYSIAPFVEAASRVHPLLVSTVLSVLDRVSGLSGLIRTPGWFLCEFARHNWEYNESATDNDVVEWLEDMHGEDQETIARLLPSVVRPEIYPEAIRCPSKVSGRRAKSRELLERELLELRDANGGEMASVCTELATLTRLLRRAGKRDLLGAGIDGQPVYSMVTVALDVNSRIEELLHDHFNYAHQGSDETCFNTFIPFSTQCDEIATQYRDFEMGFRLLNHVDRLLAALLKF